MKKLDNKGWGLAAMIVYTCIIIFFLLIATFFVIALYHDLETDLNKINEEKAEIELETIDYTATYEAYLEEVEEAARDYFNEQETLPEEPLKITIGTLVQEGYLNYLYDPIETTLCQGYVVINNVVELEGYLKCGDYQTIGYEN